MWRRRQIPDRKWPWWHGIQWGFRLVLFLAVLLIAGAYVYVIRYGVPQAVLHMIIVGLQQRGVDFSAARVRVNGLDSITCEKCRFSQTGTNGSCVLFADEANMEFRMVSWPIGRPALVHVDFRNGMLMAKLAPEAGSASPTSLLVNRVEALYDVQSEKLRFCEFSGEALGIRLRGYGRIVDDPPLHAGIRAKAWLTADRLAGDVRRWAPRATREIRSLAFARPPQVDVSFEVHPADFQKDRITIFIEGGGTRLKDLCLEEWSLTGQLRNGKLTVPSAYARQGVESLFMSGSIDLSSRILEARANGRFIFNHWADALPEGWADGLRRQRVDFKGPIEFEARIPPAPIDAAGDQVEGWVSLNGIDLRDLWVENAYASFSRKGEQVTLRDVSAIAGRGPDRGSLRGALSFNAGSQACEGRLKMGLDPRPVLQMLGLWNTNFPSVLFKGAPPDIDLEFAGVAGRPEAIAGSSRIRASDFIYNGVGVTFLESTLTYSNGTLALSPLLAVTRDGRVEGNLTIDFVRRTVDMDLTTDASPYDIGRGACRFLEREIRRYRFEGPVRATARGHVEYGGAYRNDLRLRVEGERVGIRWFLADKGSFNFHLQDATVTLDDIAGTWAGGSFSGRAAFSHLDTGSNIHYQAAGMGSDAELREIARALGVAQYDLYDGKVAATCEVAGVIGEGRGNTATGSGHVDVRKGALIQIPLFGPLSKPLSKLYPGAGYTQLRKFTATFALTNRAFHTENAELLGAVVSMKGRGDYYLNRRLDFRVTFHPLQEGMVADVVRVLTSPASLLLQFHLGGTPTSPEWEAVSLPDELMSLFGELPLFRSSEGTPRPPVEGTDRAP